MKNIFVLLTFSLLLTCSFTRAQTLFVPSSFNTSQDEDAYAVDELPNNEYFFAARQGRKTASISGDLFLFITNKNGNVLRSKNILKASGGKSYFANAAFYNSVDNKAIILGVVYDSVTNVGQDIFTIIVDTNLNLLSKKIYHLRNGALNLETCTFCRSSNSIYGFITYLNDSGTTSVVEMTSKLLKFNMNGDTIVTRLMDSSFFHTNQFVYPICIDLKPSVNNKYCWLASSLTFSNIPKAISVPYGDGYVLKIDTNFNLIDSFYISSVGSYYDSSGIYRDTTTDFIREVIETSENNIIIGPFLDIRNELLSMEYDGFGISKFNTLTRSVVHNCVNPKDFSKITTLVNAQNHSVTGRYQNIFTIGSGGGFPIDSKNDYFAVTCYDTSAQVKWHHYFGGDAYYNASNIYACNDGAVMVMAVRYDHNPDFQRDYYIFKLDSATGYPTSIVNVSEQLRSGIVVYPNPAQDVLHIKGAIRGSSITLYDMLGKAILTETMHSSNDWVVPISQLPTGNYLYKIADQQGLQLSSGKWIKN
ncbi:MAG: T9SS type A sorting domain-containing protein [Phycisphaerales bacterium]|nr:T9SS type A sorting domain-containing protein [Phycisphaerales bacterium]